MDDAEKAKMLLTGSIMKVKAFSGTNNQCAESIDKFFKDLNIEIHDIKTVVSNKESGWNGDMLVIFSYTEIK